jgi:hypothetical protein
MKKKTVPIFLLIVLWVSSLTGTTNFSIVKASTTINSTIITSDTTWTKVNSPYTLTGNVMINNGATLTVEAGTTLNLNSYYIRVNGSLIIEDGATINMQDAAQIQVNGILSAIGTNASPIRFNGYTKLVNTASLYYSSISFSKESKGWSQQTLSGSIIENAILNKTSVEISNSMKLTNNAFIGNGFSVSAGAPSIIGNTIKGAVTVSGGSPVISNNTITSILVGNLESQASGTESSETAIVSDNVVSGGVFSGTRVTLTGYSLGCNLIFERNFVDGGNCDAGLEFYMYNNVICTASIMNNTLINNEIGIHFVTGYPESISNNNIYENTLNVRLEESNPVDCANNWWGTTDQQAINQSIYDYKNDFDLGTVNFIPFLTESNPEALPNPNAQLPTPSSSPSPDQSNPANDTLFGLSWDKIVIITLLSTIAVLLVIVIAYTANDKNPKRRQ